MKLKDITCISDLYYVVGRWFTVLMFFIAFATLPFALECSDSVFSFLMCAGIAFVGCAADYKGKYDYVVHYVSAIISAVSCVLFSIMVQPYALLCLSLSLVSVVDRKRWLLWCELAAFATAYTSICFVVPLNR